MRKSKDTAMATLLRNPRIAEYDILAFQEPWKNPYMSTTHHPAKDTFHLCYNSVEGEEPTRICFLINKRVDHTSVSLWLGAILLGFEGFALQAAELPLCMQFADMNLRIQDGAGALRSQNVWMLTAFRPVYLQSSRNTMSFY